MASDSRHHEVVRVEDLIALNDEIASLITAGVPLELGLRQFGNSIRGALGRVSGRIADRMSAGHSLVEAFEQEGDRVPAAYRAVIESGLRAQRLPEALEELSRVARVLLDLHRRVVVAMIYPAIVLFSAWLLTVAFTAGIVPQYLDLLRSLDAQPGIITHLLTGMVSTVQYWAPAVPFAALAAVILSNVTTSRRSNGPNGRLLASRVYRFAWYPGLIKQYDNVVFLRTLSLLVRHQTPLHEALVLSGFTTGNQELIETSISLSEKLQAGQSLPDCIASEHRISPFLRWMMATGERHQSLADTLNLASDVYLRNATRTADRIRILLPIFLTAVIGGVITLLYGLILVMPIVELYDAFFFNIR